MRFYFDRGIEKRGYFLRPILPTKTHLEIWKDKITFMESNISEKFN